MNRQTCKESFLCDLAPLKDAEKRLTFTYLQLNGDISAYSAAKAGGGRINEPPPKRPLFDYSTGVQAKSMISFMSSMEVIRPKRI